MPAAAGIIGGGNSAKPGGGAPNIWGTDRAQIGQLDRQSPGRSEHWPEPEHEVTEIVKKGTSGIRMALGQDMNTTSTERVHWIDKLDHFHNPNKHTQTNYTWQSN